MDASAFEMADIYETTVCPLARVMRRELKKARHQKAEGRLLQGAAHHTAGRYVHNCRTHCICPPGAARKCIQRRQVPGSNAFVPAVVRLDLEGWHYVLLTRICEDDVFLFDPYYQEKPFDDPNLRMVSDHPCEYNQIVPIRCLERAEQAVYAFGPVSNREAVLLFNEQTVLTAEQTVEYII